MSETKNETKSETKNVEPTSPACGCKPETWWGVDSTACRDAELVSQLAECYRASGADPDGNEDWRLAGQAVRAVKELRADYDAACEQNAALVAALQAVQRQDELADAIVIAGEALSTPQQEVKKS